MGAIAGFCDFTNDPAERPEENRNRLKAMRDVMGRRGGNNDGEWLGKHCGVTAAVPTEKPFKMPLSQQHGDTTCVIALDGEIYNRDALRAAYGYNGAEAVDFSDEALLLQGFLREGAAFVHRLNGAFAFVIWRGDHLYVFRDHAGIKPLFYTVYNGRFIFASEIKALLQYPGVEARLDAEGLSILLAVGPARPEHSGIFKDIYALPPGCFFHVGIGTPLAENGAEALRIVRYWDLESRLHMDDESETISKVRALLTDAVARQTLMHPQENGCAFLSGGVDSSVVTALAAAQFQEAGRTLQTYSFDFRDSGKYFQSNAFQPDLDRPWIDKMTAYCRTAHAYIECDTDDLTQALFAAVDARDLPGMADIDASLLYFCAKLPTGSIALTGECADEVFGGYPWFHRAALMAVDGFPWSHDLAARKTMLSDDVIKTLCLDETAARIYKDALQKVPALFGETPEAARLREIAYLTIKWFMTTLLERMDRMGAYTGISGRVPFADAKLMAYVWNVPWLLKSKDGVVKSVLREAARGIVPDEVLFRKKSPFPKTYHPVYAQWLAERLGEVLADTAAPVRVLLDEKKVRAFIEAPSNVSSPWFGQLMAGPQRMAYLLQLNYWLAKYRVTLTDL